MTQTLQEMCNAAAPKGVLDLGNGTYTVGNVPGENPEYPWYLSDSFPPLTIVGEGATIEILQPPPLVARRGLLVRSKGTKLLGDVTVHGYDPNPARYDDEKAFDHGIELQGATDFACDWKIENCGGNSVYFGKREAAPGRPERWTENARIGGTSAHAGRQHYALVACQNVHLEPLDMNQCARSAIDIEPPGENWGCVGLTVVIHTLRGGWEYAIANLGDGIVSDIDVSGAPAAPGTTAVHCQGQYFGVMEIPDVNDRRARYHFHDIVSDTKANHPSIRVYNIDGLTVHNVVQPLGGGTQFVQAVGCTNVQVDPGTLVT